MTGMTILRPGMNCFLKQIVNNVSEIDTYIIWKVFKVNDRLLEFIHTPVIL